MGKDLEERNKIWKARWDVYYSVKALINNGRVYSTDVCLPISNITECVKLRRRTSKKIWIKSSNGRSFRRWKFSCAFTF